MPIYGFKPNPKQQVINKARALFGRDAKIEVIGTRPSPLDCKRLGIPAGVYHVECFVNGEFIATAHTKNWRKAYNLLVIEVEKAYENALYRTESV
jgi:hypothetical protein